jgi:hypothetical protein
MKTVLLAWVLMAWISPAQGFGEGQAADRDKTGTSRCRNGTKPLQTAEKQAPAKAGSNATERGGFDFALGVSAGKAERFADKSIILLDLQPTTTDHLQSRILRNSQLIWHTVPNPRARCRTSGYSEELAKCPEKTTP